MRDPLDNVELTAAVQGLRDQLISSVDASNGQPIRFEVEEINLEFSVELRRDASVKAGFKAWVISSDALSGVTHTATHKVSVKLRPKNFRDGRPVEIGSQAEVSMDVFETPLGGHSE
ncbi:trypco2 family protein [Streptomyces sp. NPDC038707]|uniref:trypco2 family protein n=1 Tax=Streptomyces sp. NPDC038707 TaxID=3154329 RepID=UPI0033C7BFC8